MEGPGSSLEVEPVNFADVGEGSKQELRMTPGFHPKSVSLWWY